MSYLHEILKYKTVEWIMLLLTNTSLTIYFLNIHFNNILPPTARYPKWLPHLTFTKRHCEIWGPHDSNYRGYCLLGLMCSVIKIYQRFRRTSCLHPQGRTQAGSSRLLQNISKFLPDYVALHGTGQCPHTIIHMHVLPISFCLT